MSAAAASKNGAPSGVRKVAPHFAPDAEVSVLGGLLIVGDSAANEHSIVEVAGRLRPHHFLSEAHRRIYEAQIAVHAEHGRIDVVLVGEWLRSRDRLEQIGGMAYLTEAFTIVPVATSLGPYVDIVLARWARREQIWIHERALAELQHGGANHVAVGERATQALTLLKASSDAAPTGTPTASDPLAGAPRLAAVALVGRERIRELAAKPIAYVWQDIIVAGTIVVIAGPPGGGKTTLLFLLVIALANRGAPVQLLGRTVTPIPEGMWIVLIEAEHGEPSTARKLVKSLRVLGVDDRALDRIIIVARRSVLIGSPEWKDVGRLVAAGLVAAVFLDTLARVTRADANDEQQQAAVFDEVARTIELTPEGTPQPLAGFAAHTRKGDASELGDVSGSTQRVGQADTVLLVQPERIDGRVVSSKVTFAKLREEPDDYPTPVTYKVKPSGVVEVDGRKVDERPLEERILARLELEPQTKNALATSLSRSPADVESAISALFEARRISTTTKTIRSQTYKAFCLRDDARLDARPQGRATDAR